MENDLKLCICSNWEIFKKTRGLIEPHCIQKLLNKACVYLQCVCMCVCNTP